MVLKTYITKICKGLREYFFLEEYNLFFIFEEKENEDVIANILINDKYLNLTITFYLPLLKKLWEAKQYHEIVEVCVHEFCHTLINPVAQIAQEEIHECGRKYLDDTVERQTCRIANVILRGLPKQYFFNPNQNVKKTRKKNIKGRTAKKRRTDKSIKKKRTKTK